MEAESARQHGFDPAGLDSGAIVGMVALVDVSPLDEEACEQHRDANLAGRHYRKGLFGWLLARPERLPQPIPARGRTTLFNVDLKAPAGPTGRPPAEPPPAPRPAQRDDETGDPTSPNGTNAEKAFALHVEALAGATTDYTLTLRQRVVERPEAQPYLETVITLSGDNLRAVADHVIEALRKAEYKATDLSATRRHPFYLPEETGVRLGLVVLTIKPLTKLRHVEAISYGIRQMPSRKPVTGTASAGAPARPAECGMHRPGEPAPFPHRQPRPLVGQAGSRRARTSGR